MNNGEAMLRSEERVFLIGIKRAITTNPFSRKREEIDRNLVGEKNNGTPAEIINTLTHQVTIALESIYQRIGRQERMSKSGDAELVRYAHLFQIFHQYSEHFDQLIEQQIKLGDDPVKVTFTDELLRRLAEAGCSSKESLQYIALFFQMRRAYFFIRTIAGESNCVQELRKSLWSNIFTDNIELYETYLWNRMEDFSTMLLGETGTGKGMAASAIGRSGFIPFNPKTNQFSESFAKTFISINLSQYPESLIESELFGHRKGSFTGAIDRHEGVFSRCSPYGSIFLDEIGDVSIPVQIKLLTVLEKRRFSPVGSHHLEKFQGRIIAATNQPLGTLRKEGRFREDFYYRLCSDVIEVPPLKKRLLEHPGEITLLLNFILKRIVGRASLELVDDINRYINEHQPADYPWPGNIRELEQCTRQVLLRNGYSWQAAEQRADPVDLLAETEKMSANQLLSSYCQRLYRKHKTYEKVARITDLDRRTVKKYIEQAVE